MGRRTVLVVGDEGGDVAGAFDGTETTVRALTDLADLPRELTFERISCVVVDGDVDGRSGVSVARGVRGLFPDLPVVVADGASADHERDTAGAESSDDGITVVSGDVSDRRVVEAVLDCLPTGSGSAAARDPSRLETLAVSMFEGFPDHLYAKDAAGRHVLTNDETFSLADLLGVTDRELDVPPTGPPTSYEDDMRVIEDEDPVVNRVEYIDGPGVNVQTSKVPWYDADGDVVGLVGLSRDISTRQEREQQLRRQNERLAKVALVSAHELRNELQVVAGHVDRIDDPDHRAVMTESLDRLVDIVDDVVALATQERHVDDRSEVWLSSTASEVWDSLETGAATLTVADDRRIVADPEALRLLFDVLLSNAVDHGGSDVAVTLRGTEDGFSVADDGPGIDVDPPERVFDAGFAGTDDTSGFGLYVAQRIANDHGWRLDVSHAPEGGARFEVSGAESTADRPVAEGDDEGSS